MSSQPLSSPMSRRPLGSTGLMVPPLCIGTSELSNWASFYPDPPSEEQALDVVRAILDGPINFLDTASGYGESERRIGVVIKERGGLPPGFLLATKVDADAQTRDFSGAQVRRCVERSMALLGLAHLPLVYLHDPEYTITFEQALAPAGPIAALQQCREEGLVGHIGIAAGPIALLMQYLETGAFAIVLSHNRYTPLNVAARPLWDQAARRGIAALNAAPFGGGLLSKGPAIGATYAYRPATPEILARTQRLADLCDRYAVPLRAVALQFSLREPRIASTVVGISRPSRLTDLMALAQYPIPEELWVEIAQIQPDTDDLPWPPP